MTSYYAALRRDSRTAFLLGPYRTRQNAATAVDVAHDLALRSDPFHHFDTPGVVAIELPHRGPPGRLNVELGLPRDAWCDLW